MSAVIQRTSVSLPANIGWLAQYPQFIVCQFVADPARPGKTNKLPTDPKTLKLCDAHDRANWLACNDAAAWANHLNSAGRGAYGIGFVLTAETGIWCLDIDGALVNGHWLPAVQDLFAQLPGVAWEYSHSGTGLHGWGRTAFPLPAHETRTDDAALSGLLEFYSRKRFIALGREAAGQMAGDALPARLAQLFPTLTTEDASALDAEWTHEPHPDWHGPTDDDALITIAVKSRSKLATLWPAAAKATFKQLWEADADKLGKHFPATNGNPFDESRADLALACHLAFFTGNHWERMAGLMRRSLLNRAKLDRPDYMHRTIGKACAWQKTFYNDGKGVAAGAPIPGGSAASSGISLDDFYAYLPQKAYIFVPTRELWVASGVDDAAPWPSDRIKASEWLSKARPVHQMTWAPGEQMTIANRLVVGGSGWIEKDGANTFNLYKPPTIIPGDSSQASPWLELLKFIYPENADHIVRWFAHRRQRPGEKVNHALVFGGATRIGKDTVCEPLKVAIGPWNCREIAPKDLLAPFNPHVKAVLLRVSEARDSGDMSRYALHEHCKTLLAAPPLTLRCNEKNRPEHEVFNVMGVIFTTNHKEGLYLPPDDARHYVAWSEREHTDFRESYWRELYGWYEAGGFAHVAAYLDAVDLSGFNPKQPPEKTAAFWMMVDAGRNPEEGDLADALDKLGRPPATCISRIAAESGAEFQHWLKDPRNRRHMGNRFESAGYMGVRNPDDKHDGQWRVDEKRQTVYALKVLTESQRLAEAAKLCRTKLEANISGTGGARFVVVPK